MSGRHAVGLRCGSRVRADRGFVRPLTLHGLGWGRGWSCMRRSGSTGGAIRCPSGRWRTSTGCIGARCGRRLTRRSRHRARAPRRTLVLDSVRGAIDAMLIEDLAANGTSCPWCRAFTGHQRKPDLHRVMQNCHGIEAANVVRRATTYRDRDRAHAQPALSGITTMRLAGLRRGYRAAGGRRAAQALLHA
jgi:hypothetical protein